MSTYTPPALNAVDFAIAVQPAHSVVPVTEPISVYSAPALNAVNFALATYSIPDYNTIDFEFLPQASGITGNASLTSANSVLIAAGTIAVAGGVSLTNDASVLSANGSLVVTGTAAIGNDLSTLSASGAVDIVGTVALISDASALRADGTLTTGLPDILGTADLLSEDSALLASGTVADVTDTPSVSYGGLTFRKRNQIEIDDEEAVLLWYAMQE
jgi:hypothetical protein